MIVPLNLKLAPALALHAKVAKFGCTRSLQGWVGSQFFKKKFFLRGTDGEISLLRTDLSSSSGLFGGEAAGSNANGVKT
jgi:hypothetical protein